MKFTAAVASLLAASVSGTTLKTRQASFYSVRNFAASCIPHSVYCAYEFDVVAQSSMFPTHCELMVQSNGNLPPVELTGCKNEAYSWAVETAEDGLVLTVTTPFNARENLTGTHDIPSEMLPTTQHGAVFTQAYVGPANFSMPIKGTPA